jgi:hypothetical protein
VLPVAAVLARNDGTTASAAHTTSGQKVRHHFTLLAQGMQQTLARGCVTRMYRCEV